MSSCLAGQSTTLDQLLAGYTDFSVAQFKMIAARSKNLGVVRDPLRNEPDHLLLFGNKTDSVRRSLAQQSDWAVPPPTSVCKKPGGCDCVPRNVATTQPSSPSIEAAATSPKPKGGVIRQIIDRLRSLRLSR